MYIFIIHQFNRRPCEKDAYSVDIERRSNNKEKAIYQIHNSMKVIHRNIQKKY